MTVSYSGEQWRNSGNTAQHQLDFSYQVGDTVNSLTSGTWTDVNELDFVGPTVGGSASALNGNDSANRVTLAVSFAVQIAPGQEIMLRWSDPDDTGSDHGLAIDDLEVTSAPLSVILEEFDATPQPNHILVAWRTSSEFSCAGFNLYRSSSASTPEALLGFVASQAPGSTQGASYAWQDFDVTPGQTSLLLAGGDRSRRRDLTARPSQRNLPGADRGRADWHAGRRIRRIVPRHGWRFHSPWFCPW